MLVYHNLKGDLSLYQFEVKKMIIPTYLQLHVPRKCKHTTHKEENTEQDRSLVTGLGVKYRGKIW